MLSKLTLGLVVLGLLVGCGGKPSGPSGTMSKEQAAGVVGNNGTATNLINSSNIHSAAGQTSFLSTTSRFYNSARAAMGLKPVKRLASPSFRESCNGETSGDTTDADSDSFPVNLVNTFGCTIGAITFSGNTVVADADDSTAHTGFTASINDYKFEGGGVSFSINGSSTYARSGTTGSGSLEIVAELSSEGGSGEFGYYRDVTVTVTDADNPLAGGEVNFSGFLVYEIGDISFTLQATTEANLVYENATRDDRVSIYKSGVVNWKDGSDNTLKLTITNGTAAWTYNGEAVTGTL